MKKALNSAWREQGWLLSGEALEHKQEFSRRRRRNIFHLDKTEEVAEENQVSEARPDTREVETFAGTISHHGGPVMSG